MKNLIKKIEKKLTIHELDYSNFLVAFKNYLHKGTDIDSALERYLETSDANVSMKSLIKEIKTEIGKKGAKIFPDLLLKHGFFKNDYEISLYKQTNEKALAIDLILNNRKKSENISKKYLEINTYYIFWIFVIMSLYLFENYYIKEFLATGNLMSISKTVKTQYIRPDYWQPFLFFCLSIVPFFYFIYKSIIILFGKLISLKEYYRIQKHQETNDVITFVRMLKEQSETGVNLHDAIDNIKNSVDNSMKPTLKQVIKNLKMGKNRISTIFENNGYSKEVSSVLKQIEHGGDYSEILDNCLVELTSRRDELRDKLYNKAYSEMKFTCFLISFGYGFLMILENYRAYVGLNIK